MNTLMLELARSSRPTGRLAGDLNFIEVARNKIWATWPGELQTIGKYRLAVQVAQVARRNFFRAT